MIWQRVSITGGSATEREARARAHAQQFWAVFNALDGSDDAFMVQRWSRFGLDLYFSPAAMAMGRGLFECSGAVPCAAPDPAETCFYAGSQAAARAWARPVLPHLRGSYVPADSLARA